MVLDWVARRLGFERKAARTVEAEGPYTWPVWYDGRVDTTPPTLAGHTRDGYARNAIVYACISRKAASAAMVSPVGYVGERAAPERLADAHPLARLLRRPNRWMSWFEMQELLVSYLELDGNVFLYKARAVVRGPVAGLFPLRPDRVRPVPKGGELLGYVYDGRDTGAFEGLTPFLPDEVIHIKLPNPGDPFEGLGRGLSSLAAAIGDVDLDNQNVSFLRAFFRNAAVPFGLLKTKQKLLDGEVKRIRERVRSQYAGSSNWHDIMILDADADYQRLGLSMSELEFDALDSRNEARICAALNVPPIIAGARVGLEHSTYSNYGEARTSFWEDVLVPLYGRFADGLNLGMEMDFPGAWIDYDFSRAPALREKEDIRQKRAVEAWKTSLAKRNEARAMVGLSPSAEDGYYADLVRGGVAVGVEAEAEAEGEEEAKGAVGPGEAKPLVLRSDAEDDEDELRERMTLERQAAGRIAEALDAQRDALIGDDAEVIVSADGVASRVPATSGAVRDALRRALIESADLGVRIAVRQLASVGLGMDWTLANTAAREWANEYVGELIGRINETTRRQVRQAVAAWVENGEPLEALIDELAVTFGRERAELIASTEVTRAYAQGQVESYRLSGVIGRMEWRTAVDERVCPVCGPLHGTRASFDETFEGDLAMPPAHPRCRCWLAPVVD